MDSFRSPLWNPDVIHDAEVAGQNRGLQVLRSVLQNYTVYRNFGQFAHWNPSSTLSSIIRIRNIAVM